MVNNEIATAIKKYNDLIQQVRHIKFWNFILDMQRNISIKSLELYALLLDISIVEQYNFYLWSKPNIRKYYFSERNQRKMYWLTTFDKKLLYDTSRLNPIEQLMECGLLKKPYSTSRYEVRLPELFFNGTGASINDEVLRLKFDLDYFRNMLDCFLARKPLREEYNIRKLKSLSFYYFDYDQRCVVEKDLRKTSLSKEDVEYLLKYIKVLEYEVGRISYEEIAGEKRETGFFISSLQDVKYHFFL